MTNFVKNYDGCAEIYENNNLSCYVYFEDKHLRELPTHGRADRLGYGFHGMCLANNV